MRVFIPAALFAIVAAAQSAGRVEGTVTNSVTGTPVAGAAVVLEGAEDSYIIESDARGHFAAAEVAAGKYEARAQRDGYAAPRAKVRFAAETGGHAEGISLRLIPLGAISGRVVDADGDPVSKVTVEALGFSYDRGKKQLKTFGRANSDDRGEYRIAGLPAGAYFLRGTLPFGRSPMSSMRLLGPRPDSYELGAAYFPSAADVESAVVLNIAAGAELRNNTIMLRAAQTYSIRITLSGTPAAGSSPTVSMGSVPSGMTMMMSAKYGDTRGYGNMAPGTYLVEGADRPLGLAGRQVVKVTNADVDVTISLRPEIVIGGTVRSAGKPVTLDGMRVSLDCGELADRTEAAVRADGTFSIRRVQPVVCSVRAAAPAGSYVKAIQLGEQALSNPAFDAGKSAGELAITLGTDGGMLAGTVVDPQGAPVADAVVAAAPSGTMRDWRDLVRSATSGADGMFELRDLAPGDYQVFAWVDVEPGAALDPDFRKAFEKQAKAIRIAPGQREKVQIQGM
jgi:protocatechuate 3,4-dioxygenase beta subunit